MIAIVVGTTAELIKIAPVFHACAGRGGHCEIWFTGQHVRDVPETLQRLDLPEPTVYFARGVGGRDLKRTADVPKWFWTVTRRAWRQRANLQARLTSDHLLPVVVVHGDTLTTVWGAALGRALGVRVAHIEAGLRSGDLLSPFPEEANRRVTSRLVDLHLAPTEREVANLRRSRGVVVLTGANTVLDNLQSLQVEAAHTRALPPRYGVATLHRFELLRDRKRFTEILEVLHRAAQVQPVLFLAGAPERARIADYGLERLFDDRLQLLPKLPYTQFLPVLVRAAFVVTDSGGLQEECAYLGLPCVVHRARTERRQGLDGGSVVLSKLEEGVVEAFLQAPEEYRRSDGLGEPSPSAAVAEAFQRLYFLP